MMGKNFIEFDAVAIRELAQILRDTDLTEIELMDGCLLYTSPSPRDKRQSRMPSSA